MLVDLLSTAHQETETLLLTRWRVELPHTVISPTSNKSIKSNTAAVKLINVDCIHEFGR